MGAAAALDADVGLGAALANLKTEIETISSIVAKKKEMRDGPA